MDDCIFCKIGRGEVPVEKLYEDEDTFVFLDQMPNTEGHSLVIPKAHYRNVFDIPEEPWLQVMKTVRYIAPIIKKGVGAGGVNIIMNNEIAAHQVVFHAHVHIIPRFDVHELQSWPGHDLTPEEAARVANKIRHSV
jgi:histidine triad (HIT) family protein